MRYTKNDMKVLTNIMDKDDELKGKSKNKATSIKEISEKTDISYGAVRNSINKLLKDGLVDYGISDGRTKTYHITLEGLTELVEIRKSITEELIDE